MELINRYSLLYFAIGSIVFFLRLNLHIAIVIILTIEIIRNLRHRPITQPDLVTSISNIIFYMVGWWLSYFLDEYT